MFSIEGSFFTGPKEHPRKEEDPISGLTQEGLKRRQELIGLLQRKPPPAVALEIYMKAILIPEEEIFYNSFINKVTSGEKVSREDRERFLRICYKLGLLPDKAEYDKRLKLIREKYGGIEGKEITQVESLSAKKLSQEGFSIEKREGYDDDNSLLKRILETYEDHNSELKRALKSYDKDGGSYRYTNTRPSDLIYEMITSPFSLRIEDEEGFYNYRREFNQKMTEVITEIYNSTQKKAKGNRICQLASSLDWRGFIFYDWHNNENYRQSPYTDKIYISVKPDNIPEVFKYLCERIIEEQIPCSIKTISMQEPYTEMIEDDPSAKEKYKQNDVAALSRADNVVIHFPSNLEEDYRRKLYEIIKEVHTNYRESLYDISPPLAIHFVDENSNIIKGIGFGRDPRGESYNGFLSSTLAGYLQECYEKGQTPDLEGLRQVLNKAREYLGLPKKMFLKLTN